MNEARSPGPAIDGAAAAALMEPLTDLVIRAGAAILAVDRLAMRVDGKADGSPVTEADLAADRIIADGLAWLVPEIPVLSEESAGIWGRSHARPAAMMRSAARSASVTGEPSALPSTRMA